MTGEDELLIRRKLIKLQVGEFTVIKLDRHTYHEVLAVADSFGRYRGREFVDEPEGESGIRFTYVGERSKQKYPLETLTKPGDYIIVKAEPREEQSVRVKASQYARSRGFASSVSREGGGQLRITIIDPTSRHSMPIDDPTPLPPKPLKYGIEKLALNEQVFVPLTEEVFVGPLRSYCNYHGLKLGRHFRVTQHRGATPTQSGHHITRIS